MLFIQLMIINGSVWSVKKNYILIILPTINWKLLGFKLLDWSVMV